MPDPSIPEPPGFSKLTKTEQLRYVQALWDRVPIPASHLDLAEARLAEHRRDPHQARPARAILDHLTNKTK
jgi:putative addiction module component (TIGR02574 family)